MAWFRAKKSDRLEATAWFLALAGYLPFAFLTIMLALDPGFVSGEGRFAEMESGVAGLLKAYAAIILSFLGGIRWGLAVDRVADRPPSETLILSVIPPLIGWFAFFLAEPWAYAIFAGGFAVIGWWDRQLAGEGGMPTWFARLRMTLSVLVTVTLVVAFFVAF